MDRQQDAKASPRSGGSFPGGKVRLPRLGEGAPTGPVIDMVDTAFLGGGTVTHEDQTARGGFTDYFTYESLFEAAPTDAVANPDDPFAVLGVSSDDDWPTIVAAHRALAKEYHPDRFVGRPIEEIAAAENAIKRVNLAYADLRRLRAPSQDRRTGIDRRKHPR